jgi:hypothetical protein
MSPPRAPNDPSPPPTATSPATGEITREIADFVLEWPNARICIRGSTNFVEFNHSYPEGRSLKLDR